MPDREKVINALRRCESYGYCEDRGCPYYENVSCLESLRKDALALLKEQELEEKKTNWINVKDQMPEELRDVLVARNGCMFVMTLINKEGENYWEDDYGYYQEIDESDYWIPLPERPEVKQDD